MHQQLTLLLRSSTSSASSPAGITIFAEMAPVMSWEELLEDPEYNSHAFCGFIRLHLL